MDLNKLIVLRKHKNQVGKYFLTRKFQNWSKIVFLDTHKKFVDKRKNKIKKFNSVFCQKVSNNQAIKKTEKIVWKRFRRSKNTHITFCLLEWEKTKEFSFVGLFTSNLLIVRSSNINCFNTTLPDTNNREYFQSFGIC